jgi:Flp pilus assembly protein TadG
MKRHRHRGLATLEFAICAPVLLLLMLATAEIGRLLYQYNTLTKAVRDGARYAASNAATSGTRIINLLPQRRTETINLIDTGTTAGTGAALLPGLVAGNVQITENDATGFISITATYTYVPMLGATLPTFGFGASAINLSLSLPATVVMRAL